MDDEATSAQLLVDLERAENELLESYAENIKNRAVGYQHFYMFGIARRTLAQSRAFKYCIEDRNALVALALTRLQLDTVLRLYAIFWVTDPNAFAKAVFDGGQIDRMKAADGQLMKDKYLIGRLAPRNSWIEPVYKNTSGLIHFSHRHIQASLSMKDASIGLAEIMIGPNNPRHTLGEFRELLESFLHMTMMIAVAAKDWFEQHDPLRGIEPAELPAMSKLPSEPPSDS
jgi:hypothetical protein